MSAKRVSPHLGIEGSGRINPFGETEFVPTVESVEPTRCYLCKAHVSDEDMRTHMQWHQNLANEVVERTKTNAPEGTVL